MNARPLFSLALLLFVGCETASKPGSQTHQPKAQLHDSKPTHTSPQLTKQPPAQPPQHQPPRPPANQQTTTDVDSLALARAQAATAAACEILMTPEAIDRVRATTAKNYRQGYTHAEIKAGTSYLSQQSMQDKRTDDAVILFLREATQHCFGAIANEQFIAVFGHPPDSPYSPPNIYDLSITKALTHVEFSMAQSDCSWIEEAGFAADLIKSCEGHKRNKGTYVDMLNEAHKLCREYTVLVFKELDTGEMTREDFNGHCIYCSTDIVRKYVIEHFLSRSN